MQSDKNHEKHGLEALEVEVSTEIAKQETEAKLTDTHLLEAIRQWEEQKTSLEENIDRSILHNEIEVKDKIEERLLVAAHIIVFPTLFTQAPQDHKIASKQILKIIGASLKKCSKQTVQMFLPLLEFIDLEEHLVTELDETTNETRKRAISWLHTELPSLHSSSPETAVLLGKVLSDLEQGYDSTSPNIPKVPFLPNSPNLPNTPNFLSSIKQTNFLPNEAKIALLEQYQFLKTPQIDQIAQILAWELQESSLHEPLVTREILLLLRELK